MFIGCYLSLLFQTVDRPLYVAVVGCGHPLPGVALGHGIKNAGRIY
jgi:hypothetical protein